MVIIQVFWSIMKQAHRFKDLKSELVQTGCIRAGNLRLTLVACDARVGKLSEELSRRLLKAKELRRINLLDSDGVDFSLVVNSAYNVGQAAAKSKSLSKLCTQVLCETDEQVLMSRTKLLRLTCAASLRSNLWFDVNRWLGFNPSGISPGKSLFQYWDRVHDQHPSKPQFYEEDKAEKIQVFLSEDIKRLGELGDFLTSCTALCNNPRAPVKDRVISLQVKKAVDQLLLVGSKFTAVTLIADGACLSGCYRENGPTEIPDLSP